TQHTPGSARGFICRCTQESNVDPAEVAKNGGFRDSTLLSPHHRIGLPGGVWVIDCAPRQAYNVSIVMAPGERWEWAGATLPENSATLVLSGQNAMAIKGWAHTRKAKETAPAYPQPRGESMWLVRLLIAIALVIPLGGVRSGHPHRTAAMPAGAPAPDLPLPTTPPPSLAPQPRLTLCHRRDRRLCATVTRHPP